MASNAYGFDFLRSEHQQEIGVDTSASTAGGSAATSRPTSSTRTATGTGSLSSSAGAVARSDLEAQYDVLQFLNSHRSSGCLPPSIIAKATAVHLDPSSPRYSASVADLLGQNPKVKIEPVPDPENPTLLLPTYGYQAKFANVDGPRALLAQVNRCPYGVGLRDLQDSYDGVLRDVAALVTAGEVIAVSNPEDKDKVLFPRGETFLVELDGVVEMGMAERYREALVAANRELQKCRLEAQRAQAQKQAALQAQKPKDQARDQTEAEAGKSAAEASEPKSDGEGKDTTSCIDGTGAIKGGNGADGKSLTCTSSSSGNDGSNQNDQGAGRSVADATDATDARSGGDGGGDGGGGGGGDGPGTTPTCSSTSSVVTPADTSTAEQTAHRINLAIAKVQETRRRLERSSQLLSTDVDPLPQIRRGEAIQVGGTWFRVSSAIREGVSLDEQPSRAQAPPSVVMMRDLSKKNDAEGYVHSFAERMIPLDGKIPPEAEENLRKAKVAKERLQRAAGSIKSAKSGGGSRAGVTGGASSQLLSSHASATNPDSLAAAFVSSFKAGIGNAAGGGVGAGAGRKRPGALGMRPTAASSALAGRSTGTTGSRSTSENNGGKVENKKRTLAEIVEDAKEAVTDPSLQYIHARRHGCTKDVRQMFLATRADVPKSEVELYNLMIQHKLIEPGEPMRRPRMKLQSTNLDNDGKPKKRRYYERKNQRMTNTHLIGHEIGAVLAKAAERQQQGKEVGDGGM